MATADESGIQTMSTTEIESTMGTIKKMIVVGAAFVVLGYALLAVSGLQEVFAFSTALTADSAKMWLKLGGIGHILVGIFVSLVAIIRTLSLMPHRLGPALE